MNNDLTIKADYYLYGIELGIMSYEKAIEWADFVIETCEEPSGEIIDLALSRPRGRNGVLEALKEIPGSRNPQLSGRYLLADLKYQLQSGADLKSISRKALDVATMSMQPEDDRFKFDIIDDEIHLAEAGTYGTLKQCAEELAKALSKYRGWNET